MSGMQYHSISICFLNKEMDKWHKIHLIIQSDMFFVIWKEAMASKHQTQFQKQAKGSLLPQQRNMANM